jgi:hypothetical protein
LLATAATLLWGSSACADESLSGDTTDSMMERLIPRNQLRSYGADDFPTFYRWYAPIRVAVVSKDENARAEVEQEVVGPLLKAFHQITGIDATLADGQSRTNVLLIVGENPRDDFQFYADKIHEVTNDPDAYSELISDVQSQAPPCYRNWRFVEGVVETAILYTPSPAKDDALSRKCVAVNFGVLVGLVGKPSAGDTITNTGNHDILFTDGDKAALRVLYREGIDTRNHLSMGAIASLIHTILSR